MDGAYLFTPVFEVFSASQVSPSPCKIKLVDAEEENREQERELMWMCEWELNSPIPSPFDFRKFESIFRMGLLSCLSSSLQIN